MTHFAKRITSVMLAILLVLSIVVGTLPTIASAKTGTLVSNTGTRHETCTSLSSQAQAYYTGDYSWENLSSMTGGNENCLDTDNELFEALHTLMSSTMTNSVSYSSLPTYWAKTDATNGSSTNVFFYSDVVSTDSLNREHVWPKSHASFKKNNGGSDLHHLRPTNSGVNSSRGNLIMGNVKDEYPSHSTYSYNGDVVLYKTSSLVEVNDNIKGDVARILLYVWCRWEEPNLFKDTPNPVIGAGDDKNDGKKVIESLETLLQWCALDPVDTWEMSRNDQVENIQGNRNVFIDYPELAWLVFGKDVPENITTPSKHTGISGNPSTGDDNNNDDHNNELTMVTTPTANTAFKLRMDKDGTAYYFNGNVVSDKLPWYLGTTTSKSEAADVYVETVDDGYKLYFYNSSNEKTYFCIYQDGTHISICINHPNNSSFYDGNGTTFNWDETYKTFTTVVAGNTYFIGTDSEHETFSTEAFANIDNTYPAHLYAIASNSGDSSSGCNHNWGEAQVSVSASCATPGSKVYTCSSCGQTKTEEIHPIGKHTYGAWITVTEPDINKQGIQKHTCLICGQEETQPMAAIAYTDADNSGTMIVVSIVAMVVLIGGIAVFFLVKKKNMAAKEADPSEEITQQV